MEKVLEDGSMTGYKITGDQMVYQMNHGFVTLDMNQVLTTWFNTTYNRCYFTF